MIGCLSGKAALSVVGWHLEEWYVADCLGFRRMVLSLIGCFQKAELSLVIGFRSTVYWLEAVNLRGSVSILS